MGTYNFTCIAKFVAKLTYMYVLCNTYIPRVYILVYVNSTALIKIWSTSISQPCAPADKIGGFMNQKSGIGKHDSNFMNQNVAAVYGFMN